MQTFVKIKPAQIAVDYNLGFSDLNGYEQVLKMARGDILQQDEIEAWLDALAPRLLAGLDITLDGKRLPLRIVKRQVLALFPGTNVKELSGAPFDTMWNLVCDVEIGPGEHALHVRDGNFEREIAQAILWLAKPDMKVFRGLTFESTPKDAYSESHPRDWSLYARAVDITFELMPDAIAGAARAPTGTAIAADAGSDDMRRKAEEAARAHGVTTYALPVVQPAAPTSAAALTSAEAPTSAAAAMSYPGQEELSEGRQLNDTRNAVWYAMLAAAFVLGAGHALAPGHGKSMVAAYLLGTEGRVGDAIALGGIVTITHAGVIFLVGIGLFLVGSMLGVTQQTAQGYAQIAFELVSAVMVLAIGVHLFVKRLGQFRRGETLEDHSHGPGGHSHEGHHHHHGHGHDDHDHDHGHGHGHDHHHDLAHPASKTAQPDLLSLGLSAGLQPCTTGLQLVFVAGTQGWLFPKGLYILLAFSAGLGAVIVSIAVAMVLSKSMLADRFNAKESVFVRRVLPMVSATLLAAVGVWMVIDCLRRNRLGPFA